MRGSGFFGGLAGVALAVAGLLWAGPLLAGILVVVGGSAAATMIAFPPERLWIVGRMLQTAYGRSLKDAEEIVGILVDLSVKSRFRGILSLQEDEGETTILFLRRALSLLVDGVAAEHIRDFLSTEMYFFRFRREESERTLRAVADFLPAFGLVGCIAQLALAGKAFLVALLPAVMAPILTGLLLAHLLVLPAANRLRERTDRELLLQKIIMEGVLAIAAEVDPRLLERKLISFLTPAQRSANLVSLQRIQERFRIRPEGPAA
ncbi:MAG: MotA/TolQ/ExbB proton channel family protein [Thermodesulfobacteriota bacterium]